MFGFFDSVEKQMRTTALSWIELAEKVYAYRRDELPESEKQSLVQKTEGLKAQLKAKDDAGKLKLGIEALEEVLRRTGGKFYPRSVLQEYVEFFVVAAIVVLGIRAYYVQPFKIPTNSMWPTYYGMTPEIYQDGQERPGLLAQAGRFVMFGAEHKEVPAPASGRVSVAVSVSRSGWSNGLVYTNQRPGRKWFVIPTTFLAASFKVDDQIVGLTVPLDFNLNDLILERFKVTREQLAQKARIVATATHPTEPYVWVDLDMTCNEGDSILTFDLMTGDQLFVDRVSYHFIRPPVGSGFVFRTRNIPDLGNDQYYIKRLAGAPGDKLEVRPPELWRNGSRITGAEAFDLNAGLKAPYRGYFNGMRPNQSYTKTYLLPGEVVTVPEKSYMALGDNSGNSLDSRYWGFVPYKDVVGRPLFVYYPFTRRFGLAR